jgi:hypothetical protein
MPNIAVERLALALRFSDLETGCTELSVVKIRHDHSVTISVSLIELLFILPNI